MARREAYGHDIAPVSVHCMTAPLFRQFEDTQGILQVSSETGFVVRGSWSGFVARTAHSTVSEDKTRMYARFLTKGSAHDGASNKDETRGL